MQPKRDDEARRVLSLAYRDLDSFGRLFMEKAFTARTPLMHRKIDNLLMNRSIKRKGIIAPRGHAKSTKTSVVYPLRETLFNPADREKLIIIISEAQAQSIAFLNIIGWNLESNPKIQHYFGSLVGPKWREDELVTSNGVRILARGTGQRIRGSLSGREGITRPNIIILDDFESETNSGTPEAIDKNKKWITRAVEPSLADDGEMVAIGTIISERAYLSTIRQDPSWTVLFFQALMNADCTGEGDLPVWAERFPLDRLMAIKESCEKRGEGASFWQEYMNICIDKDRQIFRPEWFNQFNDKFAIVQDIQPVLMRKTEMGETCIPLYVTVGCDLAIADNQDADYTVILVLGMDSEGNKYVLDYWREREEDITRIVDRLFKMCYKYRAGHLHIETVQFQQAVENLFYKQMLERNYHIGLTGTKPRTSKDARIRSLQPHYASGVMHHRPWMVQLETELETYPQSAHKDLMDALWYADDVIHEPDMGAFKSGEVPKTLLDYVEQEKELADWLTL